MNLVLRPSMSIIHGKEEAPTFKRDKEGDFAKETQRIY